MGTIIHTVVTVYNHTPVGCNDFILDTGSQASIAHLNVLDNLYVWQSGFRKVNGALNLTTKMVD